MALRDVVERHASRVFLNTRDFGRAWVRRPEGNPGAAEEVTVVFEPLSSSFRDAGAEETVTEGALHVAACQEADRLDVWLCPSGLYWSVRSVGADDEGLKQIEITRIDRETTRRPNPRRR